MTFGYLPGQRLHNVPGQHVLVLSDPHSEKVFPDIQVELSVFPFVPLASGPLNGQH